MHEGTKGLSDDLEYSQEEWSRHEAVMMAISNPKTPEGTIAARAHSRLSELVHELDLDPSITEMAHQVDTHPTYRVFRGSSRLLRARPGPSPPRPAVEGGETKHLICWIDGKSSFPPSCSVLGDPP